MNCKQGDLARVVTAYKDASHLGKIVRCVERAPDSFPGEAPAWFIDPNLGQFIIAYDSALRPIRNPGADETDEMVRLAGPAPMTLTELIREGSNHG